MTWDNITSAGGVALTIYILLRLVEYFLRRNDGTHDLEVQRLRLLNQGTDELVRNLLAMIDGQIQREKVREEFIARLLAQLRGNIVSGRSDDLPPQEPPPDGG